MFLPHNIIEFYCAYIQTLSPAPRPLPAPPGTFFRTCSCHNSRLIHFVPRRGPLPEDVIIMGSIETLNSLATIMLGMSIEYGRILKLNSNFCKLQTSIYSHKKLWKNLISLNDRCIVLFTEYYWKKWQRITEMSELADADVAVILSPDLLLTFITP